MGGWLMTAEAEWVCLYHHQMCLQRSQSPTLCVLQGLVAVDDIQPLGLQPLDESERHQRVCQCSRRAAVQVSVQAGDLGIKTVGTNTVCFIQRLKIEAVFRFMSLFFLIPYLFTREIFRQRKRSPSLQ